MKYIRLFEDINRTPEIGDYVLLTSVTVGGYGFSDDPEPDLLTKLVGVITDIIYYKNGRVKEYIVSLEWSGFQPDQQPLGFTRNQISHYSKERRVIENELNKRLREKQFDL